MKKERAQNDILTIANSRNRQVPSLLHPFFSVFQFYYDDFMVYYVKEDDVVFTILKNIKVIF